MNSALAADARALDRTELGRSSTRIAAWTPRRMRQLWLPLLGSYAVGALAITAITMEQHAREAATTQSEFTTADTFTTGMRDSVERLAFAALVRHQARRNGDSLVAALLAHHTFTAAERAAFEQDAPIPPPLSAAQKDSLRAALDTAFGPLARAAMVSVGSSVEGTWRIVVAWLLVPVAILTALTLVWWMQRRHPAPAV